MLKKESGIILDKIAKHTPWIFEVVAPALVFTLGVYWLASSIADERTLLVYASASFLFISVVLWLRNPRFIFRRVFATAAAFFVGPYVVVTFIENLFILDDFLKLAGLIQALNTVITLLNEIDIGWRFAFVVVTAIAGVIELYIISYANNDKFFTKSKKGLVVIPADVEIANTWTFSKGREKHSGQTREVLTLTCKLSINNNDPAHNINIVEFFKDIKPVARIFGKVITKEKTEFFVNGKMDFIELHELTFCSTDDAKSIIATCDMRYDNLPWYYKLFNLSTVSFSFYVVDSENNKHLVSEQFNKKS